MKFALYLGCTIPALEYAIEAQIRNVLPKLGIELIDIPHAGCCGTPMRSVDQTAWMTMAAYNLSLAEEMGLDLLAPCNGCALTFNEVNHIFHKTPEKLDLVNKHLKSEGYHYSGNTKVESLLSLLHDRIGVKKLRKYVKKPLKNLKFASHLGCHIIRPSREPVTYDDPEHPTKLDGIIRALGAKASDYPGKVDCCGLPIVAMYPEMAMSLAYNKIKTVKERKFNGIVTVCGLCQMMLASKQPAIMREFKDESGMLPVLTILELIGYALGMSGDELGVQYNRTPPIPIK